MGSATDRVVIAHDYLTQRGGAERVVLDLLHTFPNARLVTSCWHPEGTYPEFADVELETLWINRVGSLRRDPRRAFPFMAKAFSEHTITDADLVICSSSGWAHRVATDAPKIVYCHNPARWLYQPHDYLSSLPMWLRRRFISATTSLRDSDADAAHGAARYLVNSQAVAGRVHTAYGLDATIVAPAIGLTADGEQTPIEGIEPGFLLTIGRSRGYKHTSVVCEAVSMLPNERLVVVGGDAGIEDTWPLGVTRVSDITDAQLRWLYANAIGLVAVSHEDFGLTPPEAQTFGIPAVVLRSGGYLDTGVEGVTCVFVDDFSPTQVAQAIRDMQTRTWDADAIRQCGQRYSRAAFAARMRAIAEQTLRPHEASQPGDLRTLPANPVSGAPVIDPPVGNADSADTMIA